MKIIQEMVLGYVRSVLDGYLNDHGLPPEDPSEYDRYIVDVRLEAEECGHLELLRLGIAHVLAQPNKDLAKWIDWRIYKDSDVRPGIEHMYQTLWPDAGPIPEGGPPGVELVPCPWDVWNIRMPATLD